VTVKRHFWVLVGAAARGSPTPPADRPAVLLPPDSLRRRSADAPAVGAARRRHRHRAAHRPAGGRGAGQRNAAERPGPAPRRLGAALR
jgi:hypothetical protein